MANDGTNPDLTIPDSSETTPYVPSFSSGTAPAGQPAAGSTDIPPAAETQPYVSPRQTQREAGAPVTGSGLLSQAGRGAEAGLYHVAGMPVDTAVGQADTTNFAWQAAKDLYHLATTGSYGDKPTPVTRDAPVPGSSDWLMTKGGQYSPQLDPRNYPAQNLTEKIVRGAADVGTQAAVGRVGGWGGTAALKAAGRTTEALPSAITMSRQLAGSAIAGGGGGGGGQAGRGWAESAIDPYFRMQHPLIADAIENTAGAVGGFTGGLTASGLTKRFGIPGGSPESSQSPEELRDIASKQYTTAKNIQANYTPTGVAAWANWQLQNLYKNYGSSEIGSVTSKLTKLANPPANAVHVPLKELTSLHDDLAGTGKILPTGADKLRSAAADTQKSIDTFVRNPPPGSIHSGDPNLAAQTYKTADANWAGAMRGLKLRNLQTDATYPGRPSARAQVTNLVRPGVVNKQLRGWDPEDIRSLTEFAHGTPMGNALENFGASGHGGGGAFSTFYPIIEGAKWGSEMGSIGGLPGRIIGGAIGAAAYPTAKAVARRVSNSGKQLNPIIQQTMSRAPGYRQPTSTSPFRTTIPVGLGTISGLSGQ
jgi:hypothetical protein